MEKESKFQNSHEYFKLLKRNLKQHSVITWIIMTAIATIVAFYSSFPILSVFVTLSPSIALIFLLFIPLILLIPRNRETKIGIPGLTTKLLSFILIIAAVGIIISFPLGSFYLSNLIQFGFLFFIPLLIVLFSTNVSSSQLGFSIANKRNIGWTLVIAALYGLLVWFEIGVANFNELAFMIQPYIWVQYIPIALMTAIVFITLAVAIPEEFLFRAILQPRLTEQYGTASGIILSSLVFGLFHLPANFMMYLAFTPFWINALFGSLLMAFLFQAQIGLVVGVLVFHMMKIAAHEENYTLMVSRSPTNFRFAQNLTT